MGGFNFPYTSPRLESQQIFWIKLIVKDPDDEVLGVKLVMRFDMIR